MSRYLIICMHNQKKRTINEESYHAVYIFYVMSHKSGIHKWNILTSCSVLSRTCRMILHEFFSDSDYLKRITFFPANSCVLIGIFAHLYFDNLLLKVSNYHMLLYYLVKIKAYLLRWLVPQAMDNILHALTHIHTE